MFGKIFSCNRYYKGPVSDHFDGKKFFDPEINNNNNLFDVLKWIMTAKPGKWPKRVTNNQFDKPPPRVMGDELRVSYIGHVTFLIQTGGVNVLTDPVWSKRASPVKFAGPARVLDPGIKFEDLPPIDVVWISHNHYDHLDLETIYLLWKKFRPRIIVPLGNDTIIRRRYPEVIAEAYDWGTEVAINREMKFHIDPMQHWSARGIFDKNRALWAALTISTKAGNIYFIGDSGYGNGRYFKKAKEKFGSFRLALLPMGAFEPRWFMKYSHMNPEEMLRSYVNLGEPYTIPSHFDIFRLADDGRGVALAELEVAKKRLVTGEKVKVLEVGQFWLIPH